MKIICSYFMPLFIIGLACSCNNDSKTTSFQFVNEINDEILAAFPGLRARHQFEDDGKPQGIKNYYLDQEYYLEEEEDLFTGTLTSKHFNDSLKVKGIFKDGKIRQFITWYPNGVKKSEMMLQPESKDIQYVTTTWYNSGALKSKYNNLEGKQYYESGNLKTEWDATSATDYWENGEPQAYWPLEHKSADSMLHGTSMAWHKNGTLRIKGDYVNGKKDGRWTHQDSLGKMEKVIFYNKGAVDSTVVNSDI